MKTSQKLRLSTYAICLLNRLSGSLGTVSTGLHLSACMLLLCLSMIHGVDAQDLARQETRGKEPYFEAPLTPTALDYRFAQRFPAASEVYWTHRDSVSLVRFSQDGLACGAVFNKANELQSSLTHYSASRIPKEIRGRVYRMYPRYVITTGTEFVARGLAKFRAVLESNTRFVIVTVTEEGIREVQKLRKNHTKPQAQVAVK
ncbi:hypothetical protein [Dyadobacter sp. 32]|uniref:hypothetical protein n=1 Tax=Dyadobacter sp. 32 TaxID=538966 RepID=UPI0011EC88F4